MATLLHTIIVPQRTSWRRRGAPLLAEPRHALGGEKARRETLLAGGGRPPPATSPGRLVAVSYGGGGPERLRQKTRPPRAATSADEIFAHRQPFLVGPPMRRLNMAPPSCASLPSYVSPRLPNNAVG